jgi:hypothetical protein
LNKILNKYSNSVALDGNPEPEPEPEPETEPHLVHATGCKQPRLGLHGVISQKIVRFIWLLLCAILVPAEPEVTAIPQR